ncbi:low choriolytic enzyme-like [Penaeus chinensis]|uniref:low choriolytic enzyme-like n=1 Tax=Penaeus chinensis TaxID=139456 RepID=UPI001FB7BBE5|nr:low choriolytic enzyme-like [Penaeus chinensis]
MAVRLCLCIFFTVAIFVCSSTEYEQLRPWPNGIISKGLCSRVPVIIHELMHILGLHHAHQRADRSDFIKIYEKHVIPDALFNFRISHNETFGIPYNIESILHYGERAFSMSP